jgi:hypothetical protein
VRRLTLLGDWFFKLIASLVDFDAKQDNYKKGSKGGTRRLYFSILNLNKDLIPVIFSPGIFLARK